MKIRSLVARLALLAGVVVAILAAGELVAWRIWEGRLEAIRGAKAQPAPQGPWADLPELRGILAVSKPNLRGTTAGVLFETNSHAFRGPERPVEKPEDTYRIAVVGDSVAMGFGVLYEDTYAARLERALAGTRPERIEVLDIGLSGLALGAAITRFEILGLPFDPDLLIYGYTLNDIEGEHYRHSYAGAHGGLAEFHESPSYLWRVVGPRWKSIRDPLFAPRGSYEFELEDNYHSNPTAWQEVLTQLDRLAEVAARHEMCAVLLLHTRLEQLGFLHPYHSYYDAVASAAAERGFHVVRSFDRFRGAEAADLWITPFDSHPDADAHARYADALVEGLIALPAACWERRDRRL